LGKLKNNLLYPEIIAAIVVPDNREAITAWNAANSGIGLLLASSDKLVEKSIGVSKLTKT
jgi:hypothetical protein